MTTEAISRQLLFPEAEFAARIAALRAVMAARGVDLMLVDEPEGMFWLAGFMISENRYRALLVPREGEPLMLLRGLDEPVFRERSWITRVRPLIDWEDQVAVIAGAAAAMGGDGLALGLDLLSPCMPAGRFEALRAALPAARFIDMRGVLPDLRLIKSPAEIGYLRRAAAIADEAMRLAAAALGPGRSERDAAAVAARAFVTLGADPGPTGPVTSGRGEGFLHGHLHDGTLAEGDVVHIELVPRVKGYSARTMRSVVVGPPSAVQRETIARLAALQDAQIAAMRPGTEARAVDALLREPLLAEGLVKSMPNITGYTLGFYSGLNPRSSDFTRCFHPKQEWRLEAGMVFHMYTSARGLALSETVLVTPEGPELLTRLPRGLLAAGGGAGAGAGAAGSA